MRQTLTLIIATVATALASVGFAQNTQVDTAHLRGRGQFAAKGVGEVEVRGSGAFHAKGKGQLVIAGADQDDIKVEGFGLVRQDGNRRIYEGSGTVTVHGKGISLNLKGDVDRLACGGEGTARLIGKGHYRTRNDRGDWNDRGIEVRFGK